MKAQNPSPTERTVYPYFLNGNNPATRPPACPPTTLEAFKESWESTWTVYSLKTKDEHRCCITYGLQLHPLSLKLGQSGLIHPVVQRQGLVIKFNQLRTSLALVSPFCQIFIAPRPSSCSEVSLFPNLRLWPCNRAAILDPYCCLACLSLQ